MKVGEVVRVTAGTFKGRQVKIVEITSRAYKVEFLEDFTAPCGCCEADDDCGDGDQYEAGDTVTLRCSNIEEASVVIDRQIRTTAMELRGLLLKKKILENPIEGEKEIRKILECVEL